MSAAPLTIVELRASNVKRLRAVTIRPDEHGNLVVLGGRNGQGKTSVLDAIAMALGGRDQVCPEPIRRGADHAEIVVDLGELVVRRTFTPSGGGSLVVQNKEGARFQSPQTMLDALVGKLSFDPLAFARENGKRQAEVLRQLLGLDFAQQDSQRAAHYAERTQVNKQAEALRHRFQAMPQHADAPAEEVSVAAMFDELQQAQAVNSENATVRDALVRANQHAKQRTARVEELRAELAQAEDAERSSYEALRALDAKEKAAKDVDIAPITERVGGLNVANAKFRENRRRAEVSAELAGIEARSHGLTTAIVSIDDAKEAAIAAAAMPVPGLGFSAEGGVTLDGIPLEQASGAERIRVSVAIGLAMNPRLRVLLIRDASLLDAHSLRLVAAMAQQAGSQVWLERVDQDANTTVLIEDGEALVPTAAPDAVGGCG